MGGLSSVLESWGTVLPVPNSPGAQEQGCACSTCISTHTRSTTGTRDTLLPSFTRCFYHHTICFSPPLLYSACRTRWEGTRSPLVSLLGTAESARRSGISSSSPSPLGHRWAERHLGGGRKGPTPPWCLQLLSACRAGSCSPDTRLDLLSCPQPDSTWLG